jgi:hypothetical protein
MAHQNDSSHSLGTARPPLHALNGVYKLEGTKRQIRTWCDQPFLVSETELEYFQIWYQDLPFAKVISEFTAIPKGEEQLIFRRFSVDPSASGPRATDQECMEWAQRMAINFYHDIFDPNDEDFRSIERAVRNHKAIMIVARCINTTTAKATTASFRDVDKSQLTTIAAVSFVETTNTMGKPRPALILWIGFQGSQHGTQNAPRSLNRSWRRQGFVVFMIINVIKQGQSIYCRNGAIDFNIYP